MGELFLGELSPFELRDYPSGNPTGPMRFMTFNRLGIRNVYRRGSCVCPCSFYQTGRQPFRNWQGQTLICDEVARRRGRRRRGGHAGTVWSRYQIIVRPSGTQIGEQNCQIRKHVVMQQWNEIDRRQETEGGGGGGRGRRWSYCYLSDSAAESYRAREGRFHREL